MTETFSKDHNLFLIDLMRLQLEAEGKGPPRSLQDLNQRLKMAKSSKKLLWEEISGKLNDHFNQTFPPRQGNAKMEYVGGGIQKGEGPKFIHREGARQIPVLF